MSHSARKARAGTDRQAAARCRPRPRRRPHQILMLLPHDRTRGQPLVHIRRAVAGVLSLPAACFAMTRRFQRDSAVGLEGEAATAS
jgi:hypothetical protein